MDLAVYISELLGLQGEVNVPDMGHFAQVRINGYYDERESKFYPPRHEINFQPQLTKDSALAQYLSDKKNISLASSVYFIDKYVIDVKKKVASQEVEIAGLGYLFTDNSGLAFKPNNTPRENDPDFYGFVPLKVNKLGDRRVTADAPIAAEETKGPEPETIIDKLPAEETPAEVVVDEPTVIPELLVSPLKAQEQEEYVDEETDRRPSSGIWKVILLVTAIILLSLVGIYQYYPEVFDVFKSKQQIAIGQKKPTVAKPNTVQGSPSKPDSIAKTAAQPQTGSQTNIVPKQTVSAPVDTFATVHYDILGGAFKTLTQADAIMKNYQKLGLHPRILKHATGNRYKITLGTYFDKDRAQKVEDSILSATKINKTDIYLQPYKPKK
jgi:cell division protein FtsN